MTPEDTLSTTARATAACAGPNICTACVAFFMVTLLKRIVSGFAGRLGVTTATRVARLRPDDQIDVGHLIPVAYQRLANEEIRCHNYLPIRMGSTSVTCRPSRMRR